MVHKALDETKCVFKIGIIVTFFVLLPFLSLHGALIRQLGLPLVINKYTLLLATDRIKNKLSMAKQTKHNIIFICTVGLGLCLGFSLHFVSNYFKQKSARTKLIGAIGTEERAIQTLYLSQVALIHIISTDSYCLGAILEQNRIMTAAHCLAHIHDKNDLEISISTENSQVTHRHIVKQLFLHPEYEDSNTPQLDGLNKHDLALIQLMPTENNSKSRKISIEEAPDSQNESPQALLIGETQYDLSGSSKNNLTQTLPIKTVVGYLGSRSFASTEFMVKSDETAEDCHGASGSPAFLVKNKQLVLIGILSRGPSNCEYRIYTNATEIKRFYERVQLDIK